MQLNDLLENYTLKDISKRTNISEDNLNKLFNKEFDALTKVKALGFISIVEREFKADLSALGKEVKNYFETHGDDLGMVPDVPISQKRSSIGKIIFLILLIFVLIVGAWFVSTKYNKSELPEFLSFMKILNAEKENISNDTDEESKSETTTKRSE